MKKCTLFTKYKLRALKYTLSDTSKTHPIAIQYPIYYSVSEMLEEQFIHSIRFNSFQPKVFVV